MSANYYSTQRHRRPNSSNRSARPSQPKKPSRHGQYIHPSRFVKAANPANTENYQPANAFADFAIHPLLKNNIATKGYKTPSEIQDKAIPVGLAGGDVVGIADTGTGKTAAFCVPILNRLMHEHRTKALIIAPTRELAIQIEQQTLVYAKNSGLRGALLIGGAPMGGQNRGLRGNARLVIGTPGRIKDHMKRGTLELSQFNIIVLDEVDRMLDMGFVNDVRAILASLMPQRQSYFFSATISSEISSLIQTFTQSPTTINVKSGETTDNVHQDIMAFSNKTEKLEQLHNLLIGSTVKKTLIFSETKRGTEKLAKELKLRGFMADSLHGGKTQGQRKRALDSFKDSGISVLVATDVAARGIDVLDISHVVNFDQPHTYDDYVHRIGRTGRAGRIGYALTFVESPS